MVKKLVTRLLLVVSVLSLVACSSSYRGHSAGEDYCDCSKEEGILNIAKCKKEVMKKHKEDLLDDEFRTAFWEAVSDCDE